MVVVVVVVVLLLVVVVVVMMVVVVYAAFWGDRSHPPAEANAHAVRRGPCRPKYGQREKAQAAQTRRTWKKRDLLESCSFFFLFLLDLNSIFTSPTAVVGEGGFSG